MQREDWRRSGDWLGRIELLERRLDEYHDRLEEVLEHDREFQLETTWNLNNVLVGAIALTAAVFGLKWLMDVLEFKGVLAGGILGAGAVIAFLAGYVLSDRDREKAVGKLSRLPEWTRKDNDNGP